MIALSGLCVFTATAQAKPKPAWKTTKAAEAYLEHGLKKWGGVDLAHADFVFAICLEGDFSKHELRTGKKTPIHTTKAGEDIYASFMCSLGADGHTFKLYVLSQAKNHWVVQADR